MRRLIVVILALALASPLIGLTLPSGVRSAALARVVAAALGAAVSPPQVQAQTTLDFKPVPAESVPALEREGERHARRGATVTPAAPAAPATPAVPVPPVPPAPEPTSHAGDITRVGSDIHIEKDEVVQGTVMAWGGDVTVEGTVRGDVVAGGGDVYLKPTARVDGDVVCLGGELHEEPGAFVSGEKVTVAGRGGTRTVHGLGRHVRIVGMPGGVTSFGALRTAAALLRFLVAIGLALLVAWLFRGRVEAGMEVVRRHPALSLGIGALVHALAIPSLVALVLVVAILCITIIGIPLALAALLGYALFFVVFWIFGLTVGAAVVGGRLLAGRSASPRPAWEYALAGVLLVGGARFVGRLLESVSFAGLDLVGKALVVISLLAAIVLGTLGGGAWLKWEFDSGMFGRWRERARSGNGWRGPAPATPGPAAPSPGAVSATAAPVPPPPAPPEAFMPPGGEPPAPPPTATPGT